jgi:hypothetical protein
VSSLTLIAPDGTWLDIRTVRLASNENTRVSRYRRVPGQTAPPMTGARLTLADVKEASTKVSPRVVEAALVETNAGFDLSSRQLIDLADAKVASNVIDLIVALSYPQRFVVERTANRGSGGGFGFDPFGFDPAFSSFGFPFGSYDPFYNDLFYPAYYYSPFAYSYLGRFDPRYFGYGYFGYGGYGGQDVGSGGGGGGGAGTPQASGSGRFVNGVGYTRVRPREAEPAASGDGGRFTPTSSSASGGSSGGGSVSPTGYSSGGGSSSGGGGRTAQAR